MGHTSHSTQQSHATPAALALEPRGDAILRADGTAPLAYDLGVSESTPAQIADDLDRRVRALAVANVEAIRRIRRASTRALSDRCGSDVLAVATALVGRHRWMAYELVYHHPMRNVDWT